MMINPKHLFQQGMALIQVLIISIILTMLAIYISQTVHQQVKTTQLIQNHFQLNIQVESVEAELLHAMLVNNRYANRNHENPLVNQWNFYGKPFQFNDIVQITIQDMNGLLSINHLDNTLAQRYFENQEIEQEQIRVFLDSLADWKDADDLSRLNGAESDYYRLAGKALPRNGYLQQLNEVLSIKSGDLILMDKWQSFFSIALVSSFNPLNAPDELLRAFIIDDQAYNDVIEARKADNLNGLLFYQLTNIDEEDFVTFTTGRMFKVNIKAIQQNNQLSKSFIVELRPNSTERPVVISQLTWNKV